MFTYKNGDMFAQEETGTIVVPVNTREGIMGKGISLQAKNHDPDILNEQRAACKKVDEEGNRTFVAGSATCVLESRYILAATKGDDWSKDSRYEWVEAILKKIAQNIEHFDKLVIPPLGCVVGNLDWTAVHHMICHHFLPLTDKCEIIIYPPQPRITPNGKNGKSSK